MAKSLLNRSTNIDDDAGGGDDNSADDINDGDGQTTNVVCVKTKNEAKKHE